MKKIIVMLLILPILLSCMLYAEPPLGESNFPLKQVLALPIDGDIKEIAVADSWVAVHTYDKIFAMEIDAQKTLWNINMQVNEYGEGFNIVNGKLVASSQEQIILVDKQGQQKEINLSPNQDPINIIKVASVYPNFIYVIRGKWNLEVYDISKNKMLWKMFVGREISDVIYDNSSNITYVTTDSLRAFDNSSGKLLWKMEEVGAIGAFEAGILYVLEITGRNDILRIAAVNVVTQEKFWEKDISIPSNYSLANLTIIDNVLIASGNLGMIAIDKTSGKQVWTIASVGEEFYTVPVEFDGVIYAKVIATGTVYAISPDDGAIIGQIRLENIGFDVAKGGVYALKDGIVFNTRNEVVIYKTK